MSHLILHVKKHPCAVKDPDKVLDHIDIDQVARIPCVGEFIFVQNCDKPFRVEQVIHMPNHGVTIMVI
jgi:hypothetical protein